MKKKLPTISADFPYESKFVDVLDSKIHYIEQGSGTPIIFLHGMPTSNYIWRNIIPFMSPLGRCIAPDLIGMGKSGKPEIEYTIDDHINYIEKFIETLNLKHIIIIMHGWGSMIGFNYAMQHEKNCRGLVFYEAHLRPSNEENFSLPLQEQISYLEEKGDSFDILMNGAKFIEHVMPQGMIRNLSEKEMNFYQEPFLAKGSGKVLHQYKKELLNNDGKGTMNKIISRYSQKLITSYLPKLMLYSMPGFITTVATLMWAKENLLNLEIAEVGEDLHYIQESNPSLMGEIISVWLQGLENNDEEKI